MCRAAGRQHWRRPPAHLRIPRWHESSRTRNGGQVVLKWIVGSKVDHPLADPKEAKALVSELPAQDYVKALEEITRWLESLAEAEGFKLERLFEIAELLDTT